MNYRPLLLAIICCLPAPVYAAPAPSPIQVQEAWSLPSLAGVKNGVAYVTLTNTGADGDALLGASTPVAEKAELHTQEMSGDILRMREVKAASIASGKMLEMKPGGLHIMLISTTREIKENESFPLTLNFRRAGAVTTEVKVRPRSAENANTSMEHMHHTMHTMPKEESAHEHH